MRISHPYDVEAWDMWEKVGKCHEILWLKYGEGYMTSWDCYITFCQDCNKHDECFKHSEWFIKLVEG